MEHLEQNLKFILWRITLRETKGDFHYDRKNHRPEKPIFPVTENFSPGLSVNCG